MACVTTNGRLKTRCNETRILKKEVDTLNGRGFEPIFSFQSNGDGKT